MKSVEIVLKKEKEGMREKDGRRVRLVMYCSQSKMGCGCGSRGRVPVLQA
jgi:hypothetical protein